MINKTQCRQCAKANIDVYMGNEEEVEKHLIESHPSRVHTLLKKLTSGKLKYEFYADVLDEALRDRVTEGEYQ